MALASSAGLWTTSVRPCRRATAALMTSVSCCPVGVSGVGGTPPPPPPPRPPRLPHAIGSGGLLKRWFQPPDAENRMSGGVGGCRGAIPVTRPDQGPGAGSISGAGGNQRELHSGRGAFAHGDG